jgi:hypothetical protein
MKLTMQDVPSTPEGRIHIKASPASSLHPAARPILRRLEFVLVYVKVDMSKASGYTGPAYPFYSPMAPVTAISTASYNGRALGFKSCENAFFPASTILGGRDAIEEFVAAQIWPLSDGWKTLDVVFLDVDWASQKVPFP